MSVGTILLVLLVILGLVLVFLAAINVASPKRVGLLAAGLFCWFLAWACLVVFAPLVH
jgi:hypothetical protein